MKVAYCTGFWCTNIGNGFFSMGVEYALKRVLGEKNVTVISDLQTYTTSYGKRLYIDVNQFIYIHHLDVDYIVLAGPVLSKYFLRLWKDVLLKLKERNIGYILLSVGTMKMDDNSLNEIKAFFSECPPYAFSSRDETVFNEFAKYAKFSYSGICFSFFIPDIYSPASMKNLSPYIILNFDKICEPEIWIEDGCNRASSLSFDFEGSTFKIAFPKIITTVMSKTDRFTDALIYALSLLPAPRRLDKMGKYNIIRTDHRFHPHFRKKIYRLKNSYVADIPYGYLNLYANSELTLSDRVHACAVTLAFGHSAMLFSRTNRVGLLERVGANEICEKPVIGLTPYNWRLSA
ncbi:MAG TPA: hypothetical protein PK830_08135 [Candidatus Atribacteria bacterium]|nr:hypothetical protein [Candidatus Atribacteria bacterium]